MWNKIFLMMRIILLKYKYERHGFPHSKLNQEKSYQEIWRQLIKRNFMVEFIKTEDYWVLMDLMCQQGAVRGFNILPRHSSVFWLALHYTRILAENLKNVMLVTELVTPWWQIQKIQIRHNLNNMVGLAFNFFHERSITFKT